MYRGWRSSRKALAIAAFAGLYTYGWSWVFAAWALELSTKYQDLFVCLGATGILGLSLASASLYGILMNPAARYLGRISYSLYLTHATVLWGLTYLLRGTPGFFWIYAALALGVASMCWKLVEDPATPAGDWHGESSVNGSTSNTSAVYFRAFAKSRALQPKTYPAVRIPGYAVPTPPRARRLARDRAPRRTRRAPSAGRRSRGLGLRRDPSCDP